MLKIRHRGLAHRSGAGGRQTRTRGRRCAL